MFFCQKSVKYVNNFVISNNFIISHSHQGPLISKYLENYKAYEKYKTRFEIYIKFCIR